MSNGRCRGLAGSYRAAFDTALPHARQVADPFCVVNQLTARSTTSAGGCTSEVLGHPAAAGTTRCTGPASLVVSASEEINHDAPHQTTGPAGRRRPRGEATRSPTRQGNRQSNLHDPRPRDRSRDRRAARRGSCRTPASPARSTAWTAPCSAGRPRSLTGTQPASPTPPQRPRTIRVKPASNAPLSDSATSPTCRIQALLYAGKPDWPLLDTLTPA